MKVLIVGCGLYGTTSARKIAESGNDVHIVEKRNHIAGNCFTQSNRGIHVHKYGPHAFHTNSKKIWDFVNQFAEFNNFKLKVLVNHQDKIYSFPINLLTLNQVYGFNYEESVEFLSKQDKINSDNFRDFVISSVGEDLYKIFYEGYTRKQWNKDPIDLPASIAKRIPVRLNFYDYYFDDLYQGVPINGYTSMFEKMLDHPNIKIDLNVDFFENKKEFEKDFDLIIYTGKPDEYFDYRFGLLEYRSLKFEEKIIENTFQGNIQINYTSADVPYTRIIEHKYFYDEKIKHSVITYEYPDNYEIGKIPYYPVESELNTHIYNQYLNLIQIQKKTLFGGRLGRYTYLNMDQVIAMALNDMGKLCQKNHK